MRMNQIIISNIIANGEILQILCTEFIDFNTPFYSELPFFIPLAIVIKKYLLKKVNPVGRTKDSTRKTLKLIAESALRRIDLNIS